MPVTVYSKSERASMAWTLAGEVGRVSVVQTATLDCAISARAVCHRGRLSGLPTLPNGLSRDRYLVGCQRHVDGEDAASSRHVAGDDLSAVGRDRLPSNGQPQT
jgi:hypothetical protein